MFNPSHSNVTWSYFELGLCQHKRIWEESHDLLNDDLKGLDDEDENLN